MAAVETSQSVTSLQNIEFNEHNYSVAPAQRPDKLSIHTGSDSGSKLHKWFRRLKRVATGEPSPSSEVAPSTASDSDSACGTSVDAMTHTEGPDMVQPAEDLSTWLRDAGVKLRIGTSGPAAREPISIISMFRNTLKKFPDHTAMGVKRTKDSDWLTWTYKEYYDDVWRAAKAMIKLGLEPYHGVGIVGFNSPEWFIADVAAIFAGGFAAGIYTTNSPEACQYVAESCEANIIVVENDMQLQKILKVRDSLPHLKAIIQYNGNPKEEYENVYNWQQFMALAGDVPDSTIEARISQLAPNKCSTLIYTSGTTGNPKAVMLSHDNVTWTALMAGESANLQDGEDVLISYLPLSHIAAQIIDLFAPMLFGGSVYFAQPDALKGSLLHTMKDVRPTAFLGVPRVWEKMQEKLKEMSAANPSNMKKRIALWAKDVGLRGNMSLMNGGSVPWGWTVANYLVFKKVRAGLGLDRCRICISAAAPIMRDTLEFFMSLDVTVTEIYGMSESSGPHTVSFPWEYMLGSVGKEMNGCESKLENPDKDGNGEICMGGRHVFMGYLNEEVKTREAIDKDGWLHSGDVGRKDDNGFMFITGRIKEILITAGGENVAPVPIEDSIKEELPVISNCMLIGDKKKFLSILLTLKTAVDPDTTMPLDSLTPAVIAWCESIGSSAKCVSDVLEKEDKEFLAAIQAGVTRANKKAISRAQFVQKWSILPRDFSTPGGELGPTLKLKRPVVTKMYQNTIDLLYGDS